MQRHLVVTVNFRSNIFGFPNAARLADHNIGLLDQRFALELVRDNVVNFGGNPLKIIGWGESSGAIAVDFLDLAYASDPIFSGMILDSGTALFPGARIADTNNTSFTAVAEAFGWHSVECLRNVSWQDIEGYLISDRTLQFLLVDDERIVFSNTRQRYEMGAFSSIPAIIGVNQHELNALRVSLPETELDALSNGTFLCMAALASHFREKYPRTTYRFFYKGNFSNISPTNYTGAYHASELPLVMGTAGNYHGASTAYEQMVGAKMQDLWLEFAMNPEYGLSNVGWGSFGEGKAVVIGDGKSSVVQIDISELDGVC